MEDGTRQQDETAAVCHWLCLCVNV